MKKILTVLLSFVLLVNTINAEEITENENNIVENNLQNTNEVQLQKDNDTKVSDETKEVDEEYDWASIQPTKTTTSEGIEVEGGFINKVNGEYLFYLNYTIPEDYDKDTLTINPEIFEVIAWGQSYQNAPKVMPGQTLRINVTIINNSKYNYNYDKNSFVIYPYTSEELEELNYKKITDEGILFNGEEANEIHQYPRMINNALKDLVKNETKKAYDNDTLDTLLKKLNYNGIEELSKYYVDFYNNYFGYTEENKKENLRDFSVDEQIIILGVNPSKVTEDNNDLIALHFDLLFNNCLVSLLEMK